MKKRVLSFVMAMLMVLSLMPVSVFATEAEPPAVCAVEGCIVLGEHTEHMYAQEDDGLNLQSLDEVEEPSDVVEEEISDVVEEEISDVVEEEISDVVEEEPSDVVEEEPSDVVEEEPSDVVEEKVCFENCILAEGHEGDCYVCAEGCVLSGEAEHEENGWECYVWIPCALTEGCELAEGHEGDCTGASVFAQRDLRIRLVYNNNGIGDVTVTLKNAAGETVGTATTSDGGRNPGYATFTGLTVGETYTVVANYTSENYIYSTEQTITIGEGSYTQEETVAVTRTYNKSAAEETYDKTTNFNHVDIRVSGTYTTGTTAAYQTYNVVVSDASIVIWSQPDATGDKLYTGDFSGDTSETYEWRKTGISVPKTASIVLTCKINYTIDNKDYSVPYTQTFQGETDFIEAIQNCDMHQGLDFIVDSVDIVEAIFNNVKYQWKVDNGDGKYSDMPTNLATPPVYSDDYAPDNSHTIDTEWKEGYNVIDESNGKVYTFRGWDTYSTNSAFSVTVGGDYLPLAGVTTIVMSKDIYVNGYWTVADLPVDEGSITITKTVSYGSLTAAQINELSAEYKPDSYTFKVTILDDSNAYWNGYNAKEVSVPAKGSFTIEDVPYGYTYSVQEVTTGAVFTSVVTNSSGKIGAESVVNATNTYTIITETPGLNIVKYDSETSQVIEGAEFTLYSDAACQNEIAKGVTDADGKLNLPLTEIGTFYLKETKAAEGYHENNAVYTITTKYIYENDVESKTVKQIIVVDSTKWTDSATMKLTNSNANAADYEFHVLNTAIKPVIISAEKVWDDDNYYARPESIEVQLLRDGEAYGDPVALSEANNWRYVWNGGIEAGLTDEYNWKVVEAVNDSMVNVHKYISNAEDANKDNHWIITNTRTPNAIKLTVTKEWIDNNDTSYKPESIEVQLLRDGEAYGPIVKLNEGNKWSYVWSTESDPGINDAHEWSVVEIVPDGYEAEYEVADGVLTITNTRIIRDLELTVNKVWENIPDSYVIPKELEVVLFKNGEAVEGESRILSEDNEWTIVWTELKDGTKLTDDAVWTVGEKIDSELFTPTWETFYGTKEADDTVVVTQSVKLINTMNWEEINVHVTKVWEAPEGYTNHPEAVEVQLYRDSEAYGDPVKLSLDNDWSHEWTELPDCFDWEVREVNEPKGYTVEYAVDGYDWTISNTLKYGFENVSVSKVWLNPKDYTKRPTSIAVVLYRDGEAYDTVTLSESNGWHYKWTNLPDCFEWTVDEPNVPKDYTKRVTHIGNAWVITNAHKDVPLTGDDSNILLWAGATGVAVVGLGASLVMLLKKRKEEDEQA